MQEVTAFKCSHTGRLFDDPRDALRSEFRWRVRHLMGQMPTPGFCRDSSVMADWLAGNLEGVYPGAINAFLEVADFLRTHRAMIASS